MEKYNISGIYKITNQINNKSYIGCALNIENRWNHHKYIYNNSKSKEYNYSIYKAFRKYGVKNFIFSIIEELPNNQQILFEREKYWISYFNTYNNGYNETEGGDCGPKLVGEKNPRAKLTEFDVYNIRIRLLNKEMLNEVYKDYQNKISKRGFEHIWRGESWQYILPEAIQYVKSNEYKTNIKKYARQSRDNLEGYTKLRKEILNKKQNGENRLDVFNQYKQYYSISGFNKVWYEY